MATATQNYGTNTPLVVTSLQSLAANAWWQSAKFSNSAIKGFWAEVFLTIVTTTDVGDASGVINLRVAASEDNTLFSGQLSGSEGTYADTGNMDYRHTDAVRSFSCNSLEATARTYRYRAVIHDLSEYMALLVQNANSQSAPLASSGCEVEYRIHKYDSA